MVSDFVPNNSFNESISFELGITPD